MPEQKDSQSVLAGAAIVVFIATVLCFLTYSTATDKSEDKFVRDCTNTGKTTANYAIFECRYLEMEEDAFARAMSVSAKQEQ